MNCGLRTKGCNEVMFRFMGETLKTYEKGKKCEALDT